MLATLEQRHGELLALMATMRRLIGNEEIDREAVTKTRLGLGKASTARTRFLTDTVYPALLDGLGGNEAAQVRQLRADAADDRARSSAHVGKWNASSIAQDWSGFRRDAAGILAMMDARIALEKRVLYPLLGRIRG